MLKYGKFRYKPIKSVNSMSKVRSREELLEENEQLKAENEMLKRKLEEKRIKLGKSYDNLEELAQRKAVEILRNEERFRLVVNVQQGGVFNLLDSPKRGDSV